ncbi:ionotropic receptor 75a-like [Malaya genurostris]|uniref:ionotropic receptor 75a-like n=1 Tax=Malaya genurostris TaxID=325434 RepID=UPI0026F3830D|nr:ionotropic receptor 75a-like [Malaya genurostris]
MLRFSSVCLLLLFTPTGVVSMNSQLILEYFTKTKIKSITIFHCDTNVKDVFGIASFLWSTYNGALRVVDIDKKNQYPDYVRLMQIPSHDLGLTMDLSCQKTAELFDFMSRNTFFNASFEWLLFGKSSLHESNGLLRHQNLNVDSRVTLAVESSPRGHSFDLYEAYNTLYRRAGLFRANPIGRWDSQSGFTFTWVESFYERRCNFEGIRLHVIFTDLQNRHNKTIQQRFETKQTISSFILHRLGYIYINMLSMKHNFRPRHIQVPNFGSESFFQNASIGLVGQFMDHQIEVSDNLFYILQERMPYFDYTVKLITHVNMIVFRHPKRGVGQNAFLQPFDANLWYTILATVIVSTIILVGAFRMESKLRRNSREYFFTILGFICQQGYDDQPSKISSKLIAFVMLLFSSLIYQFYGTFIVGSLLTPPPKNLKTVHQLIDSNIQVAVEDLFYIWDYFNRTKDPLAIELYAKKIMQSPERAVSNDRGLALVEQGGFGFLCDVGYTYPKIKKSFTDDEICDLQEISIIPPRALHIGLEKGSPLKQYFRITLRKLLESGCGTYYNRDYASRIPTCPHNNLQTMPIDIEQTASLFGFLGIAILTSLVLLVLERIHYRYTSSRRVWEFVN